MHRPLLTMQAAKTKYSHAFCPVLLTRPICIDKRLVFMHRQCAASDQYFGRRIWSIIVSNFPINSKRMMKRCIWPIVHHTHTLTDRMLFTIIIITTLLNYRFDFLGNERCSTSPRHARCRCYSTTVVHGSTFVCDVQFICIVVKLLFGCGVCRLLLVSTTKNIIIIHHSSLYYAWMYRDGLAGW